MKNKSPFLVLYNQWLDEHARYRTTLDALHKSRDVHPDLTILLTGHAQRIALMDQKLKKRTETILNLALMACGMESKIGKWKMRLLPVRKDRMVTFAIDMENGSHYRGKPKDMPFFNVMRLEFVDQWWDRTNDDLLGQMKFKFATELAR